jgi:hypothetical protein
MGDNTLDLVCGKFGRIDIDGKCFLNVLHVPLLHTHFFSSIYHIIELGTRKQVVFTPDSIVISEISDGS